MKWYIKFLDCLFVSIAVVDFYDSLVLYPALFVPALSPYQFVFRIVNAPIMLAAVAFTLVYPVIWHRRERKGIADPGLRHAWFTGIIRYWLAVEIFNYGFAKILGTQFAHNYFRGDSTWNSLSGFDLTWNYFSYSYAMSCIIAGVQILGSALLLFRRTALLGVILLLPVMVNIVLIDIFYWIASGALMNAVLFTLGLSYLLLLQWRAIVAFFIKTRTSLPAIRLGWWKNVLRLVLTAYAFAFIYYVTTTSAPAGLTGKWRVDLLVRNGDTARANDWLTDSLSWKNIYLEKYGQVTFSPNPYVVESGRAMAGLYSYKEGDPTIHFVLYAPKSANGSFYANVSTPTTGHMRWVISRPKDTVSMVLTRLPG